MYGGGPSPAAAPTIAADFWCVNCRVYRLRLWWQSGGLLALGLPLPPGRGVRQDRRAPLSPPLRFAEARGGLSLMPPLPPPLNLGRFTASTCGGLPSGEASVRIAASRSPSPSVSRVEAGGFFFMPPFDATGAQSDKRPTNLEAKFFFSFAFLRGAFFLRCFFS
jgi:hypothetical protein